MDTLQHPATPRPRSGPLICLGAILVASAVALGSATPAAADEGLATWYGPGFQGNEMNNGQIFDMNDPTTTACNIYPLGTWLRVTNPENGRSVVVQVRDRGAFHHALDLSYAAFKLLADPARMQISVTYQVVSGPSGDPLPSRATPTSRGGRPAPATQYTVQPGDTLSGIASQFGVDPGALATWNGLADPNLVSPGQVLHLTAPSTVSPAPAAAAASARSYVVQPGDTLDGIAQRVGVSVDRLAALNNLADPSLIVVGQSLAIPTSDGLARQRYVVQSGDTLTAIAESFGVGVARLAAANQLANPDDLQPGMSLVIPGS